MNNFKVRFLHPLSILILGWLILVFGLILYYYINSLDFYSSQNTVIYRGTYLEVSKVSTWRGTGIDFEVGDKIIEVDNLSLNNFVAANPTNLKLTEADMASDNFNPKATLYLPPLNLNQTYNLIGVKAQSLKVERVSAPAKLITIDLQQTTDSPKYLLHIQLVASLLLWFTSVLLFVMRPAQWMTACFAAIFNIPALFLLISLGGSYLYFDWLFYLSNALFNYFFPLVFLWFVFLFPNGKTPSLKVKISLMVYALASLSLFLLNTASRYDKGAFSQTVFQITYIILLLSFAFLMLISLVLLVIHFARSNGLEQMRMRLLVVTLLIVTVPPTLVFVGNNLFGLFAQLAGQGTLLCLPSLLLPIVVLYSILRHNLFYADVIARISLVYLTLTLLLSLIYFLLTGAVSLLFTNFDSKEQNLMAFLVVALLAIKLKEVSQNFIDHVFYPDNIGYPLLIKKWNDRLISESSSLETLTISVVKELSYDFRCDSLSVLLVEEIWESGHWQARENLLDTLKVNPEYQDGFSFTLLTAQGQAPRQKLNGQIKSNHSVLDLLLDRAKLADLQMISWDEQTLPAALLNSTEFDKWEATQPKANSSYLENERPNGYSPIKKNRQQYTYYLVPFPKQSQICGGMLVGYKSANRIPSIEERNALSVVNSQLGLALNTALKIQQELATQNIIQTLCITQENLRLDAHKKVALELHDTVKQRVSFINNCLNSWLLENKQTDLPSQDGTEEAYALISEVHTQADLVMEQLNYLIANLNPRALPGGLVTSIQRLLAEVEAKNPDKAVVFQNNINREEREILSCFSEEENTFIYRLVQEAVSNAVQHSNFSILQVVLSFTLIQNLAELPKTYLAIEIKDNGKGFNASPGNLKQLILEGHFGLLHMGERAKYIGGTFGLSSNPKGTLIQASFPIKMPFGALVKVEEGLRSRN